MIVSDESSFQLDVVLGELLHAPHARLARLDDVQQRLRELGVFVQVHQRRQCRVHLHRNPRFLKNTFITAITGFVIFVLN